MPSKPARTMAELERDRRTAVRHLLHDLEWALDWTTESTDRVVAHTGATTYDALQTRLSRIPVRYPDLSGRAERVRSRLSSRRAFEAAVAAQMAAA